MYIDEYSIDLIDVSVLNFIFGMDLSGVVLSRFYRLRKRRRPVVCRVVSAWQIGKYRIEK
jgi:hypothetical protein